MSLEAVRPSAAALVASYLLRVLSRGVRVVRVVLGKRRGFVEDRNKTVVIVSTFGV